MSESFYFSTVQVLYLLSSTTNITTSLIKHLDSSNVQSLFIFPFNLISHPYSACLYSEAFKLAESTWLISIGYHLSSLPHTVKMK